MRFKFKATLRDESYIAEALQTSSGEEVKVHVVLKKFSISIFNSIPSKELKIEVNCADTIRQGESKQGSKLYPHLLC